jgi:hypothetical protein
MRNTLATVAGICLLFAASASLACQSDAECGLDQICNDAGQCVPDGRDWNELKKALVGASSAEQHVVENITPTEAQITSTEVVQIMPNGSTSDMGGTAITKSVKSIQTNDLRACGMRWHRDEPRAAGLYSVWRPTKPVYIIVNLTRNGKYVGATDFTIRPPNQEISLLINQNGKDYDGVRSCVITL